MMRGGGISFSNLGARINQWSDLINQGQREQIILGHQNAAEAIQSNSYYGATVGRVAGRIAAGQFKLDDQFYQLERNNNGNHLHGGLAGLDIQRFDYEVIQEAEQVSVIFTHTDPEGASGYPGQVDLTVTHTFNNQNEWTVEYQATTNKLTLLNLTNHVYFNLNGNNSAPIENHAIQIDADDFLPLKPDNIPTGDKQCVEGTLFDFRTPVTFKEVLKQDEIQLQQARGLDHPFVLNHRQPVSAVISCAATGRTIEMETDAPVVVVYTHNYVNGELAVWGHPIVPYAGITLETQEAPDAINQPHLGNTILLPGEVYTQRTCYRLIANVR